jgi:hypothetical protein
MNKPYIKNKGTTTFITSGINPECPSGDSYNKIDWDIDYNGKTANIELNVNTDGKSKYLNYELSNDDLANILNIPAFNMPLEKRLVADFPIDNAEMIKKKMDFDLPLEESLNDIDMEIPEDNLNNILLPELTPNDLSLPDEPMDLEKLLGPEQEHISSPMFETLIKPLRVEQMKPKRFSRRFKHRNSNHFSKPRSFKHFYRHKPKRQVTLRQKMTHHRPSRHSTLRRKLMTPRPKTMRVLLKPRTRHSSRHRKNHRNTSWLHRHPNSLHIYTPHGH